MWTWKLLNAVYPCNATTPTFLGVLHVFSDLVERNHVNHLTQKCGTCRRAKPLNAAEFTQTHSGYAETCRIVLGGSLMCMQLQRGKQPDPIRRISHHRLMADPALPWSFRGSSNPGFPEPHVSNQFSFPFLKLTGPSRNFRLELPIVAPPIVTSLPSCPPSSCCSLLNSFKVMVFHSLATTWTRYRYMFTCLCIRARGRLEFVLIVWILVVSSFRPRSLTIGKSSLSILSRLGR